jgi:hypothetical protein
VRVPTNCRPEAAIMKKKQKNNTHCPVAGCKAKKPHLSSPTTTGLHHAFSNPEQLALWVKELHGRTGAVRHRRCERGPVLCLSDSLATAGRNVASRLVHAFRCGQNCDPARRFWRATE